MQMYGGLMIDIETLKNVVDNPFNEVSKEGKEYLIKSIEALEQQQVLLKQIKVDLIKRAESKGEVCVDLSDGIWMELCELTMTKPPKEQSD